MARQCFLRCIRSAWKRTTIVIPKRLTELPTNCSYWPVSSTYFGHARSISQPARHKQELYCTHAPRSRRASTASSRSYAVTTADYDDNRDTITVTWDSGVTSEFPAVWLRDNCQCPQCFHESEIARNIVMSTLDVDVKPTELNVSFNRALCLSILILMHIPTCLWNINIKNTVSYCWCGYMAFSGYKNWRGTMLITHRAHARIPFRTRMYLVPKFSFTLLKCAMTGQRISFQPKCDHL